MVYIMLFLMLNVFYFYISTFPSACAGSSEATLCRSLISYLLSMLLVAQVVVVVVVVVTIIIKTLPVSFGYYYYPNFSS